MKTFKDFQEQQRKSFSEALDSLLNLPHEELLQKLIEAGMETSDTPIIPKLPEPAIPPYDGVVSQCGECGLKLSRVMGYVCPNLKCPCFVNVTC